MDLYKARTACRACRVTPRTLDYWVDTGVIEPARVIETRARKRLLYFFSFENLVQIRAVKALRDSGVSLPAIRQAIGRLRRNEPRAWQRRWLVGQGGEVLAATDDPTSFVAVAGKNTGQLYFGVVAVEAIRQEVRKQLRSRRLKPDDPTRFAGQLKRYTEIAG